MKGFFQAIYAIMLFSLLFSLFALHSENRSRAEEAIALTAIQDTAREWNTVAKSSFSVIDLQVSRAGKNVTLFDRIPATNNISKGLLALDAFSLTNSNNRIIYAFSPNVSLMNSYAFIDSLNFYYAYSNWQKINLSLNVSTVNFTKLSHLTLYVNATSYPFKKSYSNVKCNSGSGWGPHYACSISTTHCLNITLLILDSVGASYDNTCSAIDVDFQSQLNVEFKRGSINRNLSFSFGPLPSIFSMQPSDNDVTLNTSTTLHLNTDGYTARLPVVLTVSKPGYATTRQGWIRP